MHRIGSIALVLLVAGVAGAETLLVPGDYAQIQLAIDASSSGDVIEIACGTYPENLTIDKSGITLRGASLDPICVTVDPSGGLYTIDFVGTEGTPLTGLVIEGIAFTGAWYSAAHIYHSAVEFNSCAFRDIANSGQFGPGIYMRYPATVVSFTDCFFLNNTTPSGYGGGVYGLSCQAPTFTRCTFFGNSALAGGGVYLYATIGADFTDCSFSENSGSEDGLAGAIGGTDIDVTLTRCIVAFSTDGTAVGLAGTSSASAVCCDIYGNADGDWIDHLAGQVGGDGNFSLDPQFCGEAGNYNLELQTDSPCVSANHPQGAGTCPTIGSLPVGCLETATEISTWSVIKGMY